MVLTRQRVATTVPQTLEKRLEIMEAIRTLAAQEGEPLRRRQAEIASLCRELTEIALMLQELRRACDPRLRSYVIKYSPDQPRVPAGNPDGGQWTSEGGSASSIRPATHSGDNADGAAKPGVQYAQLTPARARTQQAAKQAAFRHATFPLMIRSIRCHCWTAMVIPLPTIKAIRFCGRPICPRRCSSAKDLFRLPRSVRRRAADWN